MTLNELAVAVVLVLVVFVPILWFVLTDNCPDGQC